MIGKEKKKRSSLLWMHVFPLQDFPPIPQWIDNVLKFKWLEMKDHCTVCDWGKIMSRMNSLIGTKRKRESLDWTMNSSLTMGK